MPTAGSINGFADIAEDAFDLLIQFVPVSNYQYTGVRLILKNPLRQKHHNDALAATLRVPDDAAFVTVDMRLYRFDAEILMHPWHLFYSAIEEHKVVNQFDQTIFAAHLPQILVQFGFNVFLLIFLPLQEVFLRGSNSSVPQSFVI